MGKQKYSPEQLIEIGKMNYDKLALHCKNLEMTGFWEQAQQVLKQSSMETLDIYVQSVLMELALHCGNVMKNQLDFVCTIPISNPLEINEDFEVNEQVKKDIDRIYNMPPILIQLCGLYDKEKKDDMAEYFLDSLLNILLCMAYLNDGKNPKVNEFIQKYYNKVSIYISGKTSQEHSRYIFRKLSNDKIECDVEKKIKKIEEKPADTAFKKQTEPADEIGLTGKSTTGDTESDAELEKKKAAKAAKEQRKKAKQREEARERERLAREERERREKEEEEKRLEKERKDAREQFQLVKKRIEERERAEKEAHEKRVQELVNELNKLVGLSNVKEEIQSLINLIKIRKLREEMNMPSMDMTYHMVFTGSPGTGKTTVARLVGEIYKELGVLSKGQVIETDRSGLVAGYVGQTAIKVHEIVEQAIGGILFIDEAYSLVNPEVSNDFGSEAVDALVKLMEDHRDDLVIIVAGYTEEMNDFLKSNTGLISRFNKFIDFPDYTQEELLAIMEVMAGDAGLSIDDGAKKKVMTLLGRKTVEEWKEFGNARGIRNLFEKIVMNQANRLVLLEEPSKQDLMTIKKEDVVV